MPSKVRRSTGSSDFVLTTVFYVSVLALGFLSKSEANWHGTFVFAQSRVIQNYCGWMICGLYGFRMLGDFCGGLYGSFLVELLWR